MSISFGRNSGWTLRGIATEGTSDERPAVRLGARSGSTAWRTYCGQPPACPRSQGPIERRKNTKVGAATRKGAAAPRGGRKRPRSRHAPTRGIPACLQASAALRKWRSIDTPRWGRGERVAGREATQRRLPRPCILVPELCWLKTRLRTDDGLEARPFGDVNQWTMATSCLSRGLGHRARAVATRAALNFGHNVCARWIASGLSPWLRKSYGAHLLA